MEPPPPPPYNAACTPSTLSASVIRPIVSHARIDRCDYALITLQPSNDDDDDLNSLRAPLDVVCVVDLSGSMDAAATLTSNSGHGHDREGNGLTVLDIVKHAVKTIITALLPVDRLSIVSFHDFATIELTLCRMDNINKEVAIQTVNDMCTKGSTNIWSGLDLALDVLSDNPPFDSRLCAVLLFTDGQPNVRPPSGELAMLEKRRDKKFHGKLPCNVLNTFGFGCNLDSALLTDLALLGNGSFSFIPDASFVGTVFVDATANLLSAIAKDITLTIEAVSGAEISLYEGTTALGGLRHTKASLASTTAFTFGQTIPESSTKHGTNLRQSQRWSDGDLQPICGPVSFSYGSMIGGQSKDLVIAITKMPTSSSSDFLKVVVTHVPVGSCPPAPSPEPLTVFACSRDVGSAEVSVQRARLATVDIITHARNLAMLGDSDKAKLAIQDGLKELKSCLVFEGGKGSDDRLEALVIDVEGQVSQAVSPEYIYSWGSHYLLSLCGAHRMQQCNNFKDPGVQVYTGPLFSELRDEINEIFLKLPPPQPSLSKLGHVRGFVSSGHSSGGSSGGVTINMAMYNNSSNPCFAGTNRVEVQNSGGGVDLVPISELRKGQRVLSSLGKFAPVACVLETHVPLGLPPPSLVRQSSLGGSGLIITPYHPIKTDEGKWEHPFTLPNFTDATSESNRTVYSILLGPVSDGDIGSHEPPEQSRASTIVVEGVECVALAHGMNGKIVSHPFFGCENVVHALKAMPGFHEGRVFCGGVVRDSETGLVCGLCPKSGLPCGNSVVTLA